MKTTATKVASGGRSFGFHCHQPEDSEVDEAFFDHRHFARHPFGSANERRLHRIIEKSGRDSYRNCLALIPHSPSPLARWKGKPGGREKRYALALFRTRIRRYLPCEILAKNREPAFERFRIRRRLPEGVRAIEISLFVNLSTKRNDWPVRLHFYPRSFICHHKDRGYSKPDGRRDNDPRIYVEENPFEEEGFFRRKDAFGHCPKPK